MKTRAQSILESYDEMITQMQTMMDRFAQERGGYINRPKDEEPAVGMTPLSEIMDQVKGAMTHTAPFPVTGTQKDQDKWKREQAGRAALGGVMAGVAGTLAAPHVLPPLGRIAKKGAKAAWMAARGTDEQEHK